MRKKLIEQFRRRLDQDGYPRLEMSGIVAITAIAGFLASGALLELGGMRDMAMRYPCAVLLAYAVFVGQLWLWLRWRGDGVVDHFHPGSGNDGGPGSEWAGGGGSSGGGGASASWDSSAESGASLESSSDTSGDLPDIGIPDIDEPAGCVVVAIIAVIGIVLIGGVYLIWMAPGLLAEIVLDAALAGGLYRRLRKVERQHWLRTVLRRTAVPFLVTAIVLGGIGHWAQRGAPEIESISDAVKAIGIG